MIKINRSINQNIFSAYRNIGLILFFSLLFIPTVFQLFKLLLLTILLFGVFVLALIRQRIFIHKNILFLTTFYVIINALYILYGFINYDSRVFRISTVYVIWPIVFTLLISYFNNYSLIKKIYNMFFIIIISIFLYNIYSLLFYKGIIPEYLFINLFQRYQGLTTSNRVIEMSFLSTASMMFLVPFCFSTFLLWNRNPIFYKKRLLFWISWICSIIIVLLSGRRALYLTFIISPVLTLMFGFLLPRKEQSIHTLFITKFILISVAVLAVIIIFSPTILGVNIQNVVEYFREGFNTTNNLGAIVRKNQFNFLIDQWLEAPLFGKGLGAMADPDRVDKIPWAYELSYVLLLFHIGIIGYIAYSLGIFWIYYNCIKIIRVGGEFAYYTLSTLVGTSAFLIAYATNPYLSKFDYMWVIFLPIGIINFYKLKNGNVYE